MAEEIDPFTGIRSADIVIAILGPRGAGKSHFLDLVTGQTGRRTTRLSSFRVQATRIVDSRNGKSLVLVELPGFGASGTGSEPRDTAWSDFQALQEISTWLWTTYESGIFITGVVYVQRLMDEPEAVSEVHKNCRLLYDLCGDAAAKRTHNVILVTTMWDATETRIGATKEKELESNLWKRLIDMGAQTHRLTRPEDGWTILEKAAKRRRRAPGALLLQQELVREGKKLKDTRAGNTLFTSLNALILRQEQQLQETRREIETYQVSNNPALKRELRALCQRIEWDLEEAKKDVEKMEDWDGKPQTGLLIPSNGPINPSSLHSVTSTSSSRSTVLVVESSTARTHSRANTWDEGAFHALETQPNDYSYLQPRRRDSVQSPVGPSELEQVVRTLVLEIARNPEKRLLAAGLQNDEAQCMVDYLDQLLSDRYALHIRERKYLLNLLIRVAKSAQVYPASCELTGVDCDLTQPQTEGGFSYIYRGVYKGQDVCVKAVRRWQQQDARQENLVQAQAKELVLWSHLSHINVLQFHGVFHSGEELPRICIVSPWMRNGDLGQFLRTYPTTPKMPLVLDVITGLVYLHEYSVIHGDLKAKNILISEDGRAMIADFGISAVSMTVPSSNRIGSGTANWMAPELLTRDEPATTQSDVWAFGCVCYEVFTGNVPFYDYQHSPQLIAALIHGPITPFTLRKPEDKRQKDIELRQVGVGMQVIMGMCWEGSPALRPSAEMIRRAIARLCGVVDIDDIDDRQSVEDQNLKPLGPDVRIDHHRLYAILTHISQSSTDNNGDDSPPRNAET